MFNASTARASSVADRVKALAKTFLRRSVVAAVVTLVCASQPSPAQNVQHTRNTADEALKSGLRVDPSTLGLTITIPFGSYAGRGGLSVPVGLRYSSKGLWNMEYVGYYQEGPCCEPSFTANPQGQPSDNNYSYVAVSYDASPGAGWESAFRPPSILDGLPHGVYDAAGDPCEACEPNERQYVQRLRVVMPDGSTHELRRGDGVYHHSNLPTGLGTYHSVDGSRLRYVETAPATGTLYLPDGSRFLLGNQPHYYLDRNGNRLLYNDASGTWTDTLGREVGLVLTNNPTTPTSDHVYSLTGFGGAARQFTFRYRYLADLRGQPAPTTGDMNAHGQGAYPGLFQSAGLTRVTPAAQFNPVVLTEIVLPDGSKYRFGYNEFGEVDRVIHPTGGYERYLYAVIPGIDPVNEPYAQTNRGVTDRWVSPTGAAADELHTHYAVTAGAEYVVTVTNPDGAYTERRLHRGRGPGAIDFGFDDSRAGMTYDERFYSATGQMLRRTLTQWGQTGPQAGGSPTATRDPRVTRVTELILDADGVNALAKTTKYEHDADLNVALVTEHDFEVLSRTTALSVGIASIQEGAVLRKTQTTFLVNDPALDANTRAAYRERDLVSLPTSTVVRDGSDAVVARTEFRYDEPGYYIASYGPVTGWADPATLRRGNPTTVRSYAVASSAVAPTSACPAGVCVDTHAEYDLLGNVTGLWDGNGVKTTTGYSSAHAYAYPTSVTTAAPNPAAVPNPSGGSFGAGTFGSTTGFTSTTAYDPSTGLVTSTTDANGKTSFYDYSDPFDRLKKVELPDGGRTTYLYVDNHPCGPLVETRTLLDAAGREVSSWRFFDGLGRPYLSESWDGQDAANPYLRVDTRYDSMGRVSKVSNPYRTQGCTAAANPSGRWTTTEYDALGRVTKVTTPDGAAAATGYDGNLVTVTDQAGRKRSSASDALGRLTQVTEDPAPGGLNYATNYTYDTLDNLRTVTQGAQTRTFGYDSLGRLTSAANPESGAVSYAYDPNGNLKTKTDARGVTASYTYDRLNRNIIVHYAGGAPSTPQVTRHYDNGSNNHRGRLWYSQVAGVVMVGVGYDVMGRPKVLDQQYWDGSGWGAPYRVQRTYDLVGNVLTQTYPSGHAVAYNYDDAGRLGDNGSQPAFAGNLGDGVARTYASGLSYSEFGGLRQERFGTQTPLYQKRHYNVRGQLHSVRLSTHSLASNEFDWNRGSITSYYDGAYTWGGAPGSTGSGPDNNGNLRRSETFIPGDEQYSSFQAYRQDYEYDALNRLKSVAESRYSDWGGQTTPSFRQAYRYDRWGNRTIDADETQVHGQSPGYTIPEPQFSVDTQTNRLGVPAGQAGQMTYDPAGNLVHDTYTGQGARTYDAENRMTGAAVDTQGNWAYYTYDADGRRVKRKIASEEWWQVYGMDGELLAEYRSGAATYVPSKEYGYRGGELLVTMSSGDDQRLRRFVYNLYYGALQRDPTAQELQVRTNELAAAGAQGEAQLLQKAKEIARALFLQTNYGLSPYRTDAQYAADLYYAYLHRAPDAPGLNHWAGAAAGGVTNRSNVCDAFQESPEFSAVVSTLYGEAESDGERRDRLIQAFHLGGYGRFADATELGTWRAQLDAAAALGAENVKATAESLGRGLFASQVSDLSLPAQQFVTNLYEGFLQRGPDVEGLSFWAAQAGSTAQSRQNVLNAFATCPPFRELAGTLYRETFWLVSDHLDTPRMVADRTGSLAGVRRHDYLPFGEEIQAGVGGRTAAQGYGQPNMLRERWATYERDDETGLDYAQARYYSSTQGRFTSPDEFTGGPEELYYFADDAADNPTFYADIENPQSLNKYQYTYNNSLRYTDPTGHCVGVLAPICTPAGQQLVRQLERVAPYVAGAAGAAAAAIGAAVGGEGNTVGDPSCPACGGGLRALESYRAEKQQEADRLNIRNQDNSGEQDESPPRGSRNPATAEAAAEGRRQHKEFKGKVKAKPGWKSEPPLKDPKTGKTVKPDAVTPNGRPVELKPNTPSGRRQGRRQLPAQERATGKKGRVVYYDPKRKNPENQ